MEDTTSLEQQEKIASNVMNKAISEQTEYQDMTSAFDKAISSIDFVLDPKLKVSAQEYIENLMNNRVSTQPKRVDLDGSKKSFFGRLKNKAKNFLKPHNEKALLEDRLQKLTEAYNKNPFKFKEQIVYEAQKNGGKASYQSLVQQHNNNSQKFQDNLTKASENKKEVEAKIKAENKMKLKLTAKENVGLANNLKGEDKLAQKAESMKNMSPQERLAFRMSQLRGTNKDNAPKKPVVKTTVNSQLLAKNLSKEK